MFSVMGLFHVISVRLDKLLRHLQTLPFSCNNVNMSHLGVIQDCKKLSSWVSEYSLSAAHATNLKQIIENPKWMLETSATRLKSQYNSYCTMRLCCAMWTYYACEYIWWKFYLAYSPIHWEFYFWLVYLCSSFLKNTWSYYFGCF